jgi:purine-binding chemotaxis protein CheW
MPQVVKIQAPARGGRRTADAGRRIEYLGFRLAGETYAVPVVQIAAILKPPPITEVPRGPHTVRGVVSVRGRLVTVIDLRRSFHIEEEMRFVLEAAPIDRKARILLTDVASEPMGRLVDEVCQVWRLAQDEIEPADVLGNDQPAYITGIGRPTGTSEVLILLDLRPIVEAP